MDNDFPKVSYIFQLKNPMYSKYIQRFTNDFPMFHRLRPVQRSLFRRQAPIPWRRIPASRRGCFAKTPKDALKTLENHHDFMGFYSNLVGCDSDFMGFYGDLMGYSLR